MSTCESRVTRRISNKAGCRLLTSQQHSPEYGCSRDDLLKFAEPTPFGQGRVQLPAPPMLMFDRITKIGRGGGRFARGQIEAELDVGPRLWFFNGHFLGDPLMPGCLGLEAMWQLASFWLGWSGAPGKVRATGVGEMKFQVPIQPDTKLLRYEVDVKRVQHGASALAMLADGAAYADGKCALVANDIRVALVSSNTWIGVDPCKLPSVASC